MASNSKHNAALRAAAKATGYSVEDILLRERTNDLSHSRQAVMLAMREHFPMLSNPELGVLMDRRPDGVLRAIKQGKLKLTFDPAFKAMYERCLAAVRLGG